MNEFIEQFLLESRELVEQATHDLLVLEKSPTDRERLDSAFRAFHTLKGGAGIVDFAAMEKAVHAAEDVLAAVRSGLRPITERLVGDCLACLDLVLQWMDSMQVAGELPADAQTQARAMVERFATDSGAQKSVSPQSGSLRDESWVGVLLAKHPRHREQARTAIRYVPDPDCFFRGEDPLARVSAFPGLLAIDLEAAAPWPPLAALDPFSCNLVLLILTSVSESAAVTALGAVAGMCEIRSIAAFGEVPQASSLPALARELLEAQMQLLAEKADDGAAGRIASAAVVVANVLRYAGRVRAADRIGEIFSSEGGNENSQKALREAIATALRESSQKTAATVSPNLQDRSVRTLRVDADRINALVNLTGELTVAKNAFGHASKLAEDTDNPLAGMLKDRHAVLDRLIAELQRSVLGLRVLPLRHVFQRFPRLVREMSMTLGKPANLIIEGDDTEADKIIVEMLFEPLLHVLRNAMDHGIESASVRAAGDKAPIATIRLSAHRQGEHVVVELSDDGGGMDIARIRQVARQRNVATTDDLASLSDREVVDLIFAPGFSTATMVTGLSGRGVGMDAVRTAVERSGGHVTIETQAGTGTTVRFTLPFSVMMTQVMTVEAGGQMFGIPLDAVVETIRVGTDTIAGVGAAHAIVLRNKTVPLLELAAALGVAHERRQEAEATIVVTRIDGHVGALRVDRIEERMEVMLKPLEGLLAGMPGVAGSTLLGDGTVLLVLDLWELMQ
jgi:two-component system chemotaxis sensor kinase CheA